MSEYNGYIITPAIPNFTGVAEVVCVTYSVRKGQTLVRNGIVYGPFNKLEDAFSAAQVDAHGWIDRQ